MIDGDQKSSKFNEKWIELAIWIEIIVIQNSLYPI